MPLKQRQDNILKILESRGFATVRELMQLLDYSSATINRDLNALESKHLVKRSRGSVELAIKTIVPGLPFRYDFNKSDKRAIGMRAAEFIADGDTVFIDASTTASYICSFIFNKKNIHVITNNIQVAILLADSSARITVLGGMVFERPSMLAGELTVENIGRFHVDKAFFSTCFFSDDGRVSGGDSHHLIHRKMIENSKQAFFLADKKKLNNDFGRDLCTFAEVYAVISNYSFSEDVKKKYQDTIFINSEK